MGRRAVWLGRALSIALRLALQVKEALVGQHGFAAHQ
jgi:hypothetical protein